MAQAANDVVVEAYARIEPSVQRWSLERIEAAIGEPLMVSDPLLTAVQAAALLEVSLVQLGGLVMAGRLNRSGVSGHL
jgi:hypothetical protein